MQYISSSRTDVGKVRSANEDNMGNAQTPNGHVFVVCDGMGGHVGGATASHIAVSSILEYFQKEKYDNLIQAIDRSLVFANEQVYARSLNEPELKGMGTTALVLVVKGEECFIGHVGDSRIYLKSDGKLNRLTKDHSFVQTLVDAGVISDEDAESHPNKNQILKAMGIAPILEPTICDTPILPKNGDVFLLCSDGLNGMVNDKTIEMMLDAADLDLSSTNLIHAALDAGGQDNVTVTLVGITESSHKNSQFKDFNPKPKVANTREHESDAISTSLISSKRRKWILIGFGTVLLATILISYFKIFDNTSTLENKVEERVYSKKELEKWEYGNRSFLWNANVACKDDTLLICDKRIKVVISNKKVIDVIELIHKKDGTTQEKGVDKPKMGTPKNKEDVNIHNNSGDTSSSRVSDSINIEK